MPLINCKVELSLEWYENCILSSAGTAEDNVKLSKLLSEGFERPIYWSEYKVISNKNYNTNEYIREQRGTSIQGINRLFVFPYITGANVTTENSYDKYFLSKLKIDNYNIEIDGRNFYDQSINDSVKQYHEIGERWWFNRTRWWLHNWLFISFCLF